MAQTVYEIKYQGGYCIKCGSNEDLRMGLCFDCAGNTTEKEYNKLVKESGYGKLFN